MSERWKPVVGYEGLYEVSDAGRVRSPECVRVDRNGRSRRYSSRILVGGMSSSGYQLVCLTKGSAHDSRRVHVLVLEAFVGCRPLGRVACHYDGDKWNNNLSNLRWGTHSENMRDNVRLGNNVNAGKSSCPAGHPYNHENTYVRPLTGQRTCRICRRDTKRRSDSRRRNL